MDARVLICGQMRPRLAKWAIPCLTVAPCNCLLIQYADDLVLVDTGLGTLDIEDPRRLGHSNVVLNARAKPEDAALMQIQALGFGRDDVTHIICTHLDRDHAGGLPDFPGATVHVHKAERDAAVDPPSERERERYRRCHFAHGPDWATYDEVSPDPWFGLDCIRPLRGLPPSIALVPLFGHTRGQCGVAVQTTDEGWVFHCGDAFYVPGEMDRDEPEPRGIRWFRRFAHLDHARAMRQLERLARFREEHAGEVRMLCSHDRSVTEGQISGTR